MGFSRPTFSSLNDYISFHRAACARQDDDLAHVAQNSVRYAMIIQQQASASFYQAVKAIHRSLDHEIQLGKRIRTSRKRRMRVGGLTKQNFGRNGVLLNIDYFQPPF
jgi:hypothetical protein